MVVEAVVARVAEVRYVKNVWKIGSCRPLVLLPPLLLLTVSKASDGCGQEWKELK